VVGVVIPGVVGVVTPGVVGVVTSGVLGVVTPGVVDVPGALDWASPNVEIATGAEKARRVAKTNFFIIWVDAYG
jgi:hypothetical protein